MKSSCIQFVRAWLVATFLKKAWTFWLSKGSHFCLAVIQGLTRLVSSYMALWSCDTLSHVAPSLWYYQFSLDIRKMRSHPNYTHFSFECDRVYHVIICMCMSMLLDLYYCWSSVWARRAIGRGSNRSRGTTNLWRSFGSRCRCTRLTCRRYRIYKVFWSAPCRFFFRYFSRMFVRISYFCLVRWNWLRMLKRYSFALNKASWQSS